MKVYRKHNEYDLATDPDKLVNSLDDAEWKDVTDEFAGMDSMQIIRDGQLIMDRIIRQLKYEASRM